MSTRISLNDDLIIDTSSNVGIGTTAPSARLHITGSGATSSTWSVLVYNHAPALSFGIRDDGNVGINTSVPYDKFTVNGTSGFTGSILPGADATYNLGSTASRWLTAYASIVNATTVNATAFTGSLTKVPNGQSYIAAGTNVTVVSGTSGQITISSTGGSSTPNIVLPFLVGTANTSYLTSSKQSIGAAYVNVADFPPIVPASIIFRAILETTDASYLAYIDLYDIHGIVQWPPGVIQESIMSCSSLTPTMTFASIAGAIGTVTGSGVFEARLWMHPSGSGQQVTCKGAQIEVRYS